MELHLSTQGEYNFSILHYEADTDPKTGLATQYFVELFDLDSRELFSNYWQPIIPISKELKNIKIKIVPNEEKTRLVYLYIETKLYKINLELGELSRVRNQRITCAPSKIIKFTSHAPNAQGVNINDDSNLEMDIDTINLNQEYVPHVLYVPHVPGQTPTPTPAHTPIFAPRDNAGGDCKTQ